MPKDPQLECIISLIMCIFHQRRVCVIEHNLFCVECVLNASISLQALEYGAKFDTRATTTPICGTSVILLLAHARLVCAPSYIIAGHLLFLSCLFVLSNYPVLSSEWLLCPLANYESTILARRAVHNSHSVANTDWSV